MKKLLALSTFLVTSGAALAADPLIYSPTPAYDWSGLWVGASLGYVSGSVTGSTGGTPTSGPSGTDVDIHASYSWQNGNWVYGPFVAIPFGGASGTIGNFATMKVDWAAVAGFTVGYAMDRWQPYALVGAVVGSGTVSTGSPASNTHYGYTLGLGVQYAVTDRVAVGARYAFVSTDQKVYGLNSPTANGWNGHSIVATLNFRLY